MIVLGVLQVEQVVEELEVLVGMVIIILHRERLIQTNNLVMEQVEQVEMVQPLLFQALQ